MGQFYDKASKSYRYDFVIKGKRYPGPRGFPTKKAARDAEAERRRKIKGDHIDPFPSFRELVGAFLTESQRTKSEDWTYQLEIKLNKAFAHLKDLHPQQITRGHIQPALDKLARTNKPRSVNECRKIINAVLNYGVKMGALPANPVVGIAKTPEPETQVQPISKAHLTKLILAADVRLKALLLFLSQTGARFVEASRLRRLEVFADRAEPFCELRTRKNRGGHERIRPQPLTAVAVEAIMMTHGLSTEWVFPGVDGGPLKYRTEERRLKRLCKRLRVPAYGFHQVRHWTGLVATSMGKSKKAVANFLGHTNTAATERYLHVLDAEMWDVAKRREREMADVATAGSSDVLGTEKS
jgi:integrase